MVCNYGRYACVEMLLDTGVDANTRLKCQIKYTPAVLASQNGHVQVLALLLARNADSNLADSFGCTAAHWASEYGYRQILQLLVKGRADLSIKDSNRDTPLDWARMCKQPECVDNFLSHGASGVDLGKVHILTESKQVGTAAATVSLSLTVAHSYPLNDYCHAYEAEIKRRHNQQRVGSTKRCQGLR
jgi:ankyrin repeat protein